MIVTTKNIKRIIGYVFYLTLVSLLCLTSKDTSAQHYSKTNLGEKDQFIQNEVYSIGQDNDGFVYIATDMGLYQYDGLRFNLLKSDPRVDNNLIVGITRLNHNINVCQTINGKVYYIINGEIRSWLNDSLIKQVDFEKICLVRNIDTSRLIAASGTYTYFYLLSFNTKGLEEIRKIDLPVNHAVVDADAGPLGGIFVCDSFGLKRTLFYDPVSDVIKPVTGAPINVDLLRFLKGNRIIVKNVGRTQFGSFEHEGLTLSKQTYDWHVNNSFSFIPDDIWVCCSDGLKHINSSGNVSSYLEGINVNTVYQDRDSNLWVGTVGEGVYILSKREGRTVLTSELSNPLCIAKNSSNVAVGGKNRVALISKNQIKIRDLNMEQGREFVKDITFKSDSEMLVASDHGIVNIGLDDETRSFQIIKGASKAVAYVDSILWYGMHDHLGYFNYRARDTLHPTTQTRVYALAVDQDSFVWCASQHGLLRTRYNDPQSIKHVLLDSCQINDIVCYNNHVYLATTCGAYFIQPNAPKKNWIIKETNCLKIDVREDKLALATAFGAFIYDKIDDGFSLAQVIEKENGLPSNIINDIRIAGDSIWIATSRGLNVIPWRTKYSHRPRNVNILSLSSSDSAYPLSPTVTLKPNNRTLTVEFASMVLTQNPLYEYRLLPTNERWIRTNDNKLSFSQLSTGRYHLEVRNYIEQNGESGGTTSLEIIVPPKYYETMAFRFLLWATILIAIVGFTIWRVNRFNRLKHERIGLKQQLYQLELEAIKAQMNPHFIHNCLNSIYYSVMSNNEKAAPQLASFSKLIRTTLDFSKLDIITITEEKEYLTRYLNMEKLRFKENLNYTINLKDINPDQEKIPTMMVQPFLENSIKHGIVEGSSINIAVRFEKSHDVIRCVIEDDGPGYDLADMDSRKTPQGTVLTESRAEMYNKIYGYDISVSTINLNHKDPFVTGTRVTLKIPVI